MANPEHRAILKQGVEQWNEWREEHSDVRPNLSGAHLSEVRLVGAILVSTDLSRAKLAHSNLGEAAYRQRLPAPKRTDTAKVTILIRIDHYRNNVLSWRKKHELFY